MARLSFISACLLALSSQTGLTGAVDDVVDDMNKAPSSSSNLRGMLKTTGGADAAKTKVKAASEGSSRVLVDEEPNISPLERVLDNNQNDVSIFSQDFDAIPSPRIVNGGRANRGRYPYYVSIYTDSWWGPPSHSCGGSLIAPDVVLCAGENFDLATLHVHVTCR